ncbi:MAG: uroporphyrinogen decarboxylase family protein [Spirochaetota bacterium]
MQNLKSVALDSRSLVYDSLEFNLKGRIPRQLWLLPWAEYHYPEQVRQIRKCFPDDIVIPSPAYGEKPHIEGNPHRSGTYLDEWGCEFVNIQDGIIGEVKYPLLKRWEDVKDLRVPLERLTLDIESVNKFCQSNRDKFILSDTVARPFERLQFLRTSINLYYDIFEQPDGLKELIRKVHAFYIQEMEVWTRTEVDGLAIMDDWGSQKALLISPSVWREMFKPLYKEYVEIAHAKGKKLFMHSDGNILDIVPDLIEIGVDALNSQVFCIGLKNLKSFSGKITFWGEIDRQHLLVNGTKEDIQWAVKELKELLFSRGGVIAQCEFGPGAKPENVFTVFETWDCLSSM